jgi:hypothetical protein
MRAIVTQAQVQYVMVKGLRYSFAYCLKMYIKSASRHEKYLLLLLRLPEFLDGTFLRSDTSLRYHGFPCHDNGLIEALFAQRLSHNDHQD